MIFKITIKHYTRKNWLSPSSFKTVEIKPFSIHFIPFSTEKTELKLLQNNIHNKFLMFSLSLF